MEKLSAKAAEAALIDYAMTFPGAWKDHPWEHTVIKVGKKIFVFFGGDAEDPQVLSVTVKLPVSCEMALTLPWVHKAGHGLWKAGWVHASQNTGEDFDLETLRGWIVQSYHAVTPKKLVKQLAASS
ncbi:MAG TPA: MmcQ/YjbR family DNA-binding protein [Caulobacteraceae bacterium]